MKRLKMPWLNNFLTVNWNQLYPLNKTLYCRVPHHIRSFIALNCDFRGKSIDLKRLNHQKKIIRLIKKCACRKYFALKLGDNPIGYLYLYVLCTFGCFSDFS